MVVWEGLCLLWGMLQYYGVLWCCGRVRAGLAAVIAVTIYLAQLSMPIPAAPHPCSIGIVGQLG